MDWTGWETDVLTAGSWPTTTANVTFLAKWQPFEQSSCANNPLNTTLGWAGATTCNSVGVKNYPTHAAGAAATAATFKDGFYPNIVAALNEGNPYTYPDRAAIAQEITTWGTPAYAQAFFTATGGGQPGSTAPPTAGAVAPSGHRGYADLRNSVARHLPAQLRASRRTGEATLRTLTARRRVKGH